MTAMSHQCRALLRTRSPEMQPKIAAFATSKAEGPRHFSRSLTTLLLVLCMAGSCWCY